VKPEGEDGAENEIQVPQPVRVKRLVIEVDPSDQECEVSNKDGVSVVKVKVKDSHVSELYVIGVDWKSVDIFIR
jgi:hypothetical protein